MIHEEQMRAVKEALHVSKAPSTIVCREDEQRRVFEFVKGCLDQQKAGSLYICGCPGTGKSLSMERVVQRVGDLAGLPPVDGHIVCELHFTDKDNRYIQQEPLKKDDCYSSPLHHLQSLFSQKQESSSRMMLIIADEMDFLITKDRGVLHDLFMLTTLPFSSSDMYSPPLFICTCVANAIDLADRFLPKLKSLNCENLGLPGPESQGPTPADPVVRIDHMATALSKTFKSPVVDTIQSLPQHQQIIICSAAKAFRGTKKDATIGEKYVKSWAISPAGITDFTNMCTVLNDQVTTIADSYRLYVARRDKVKRVSLRVDESDITFSLQGIRFFRNCLL
ncbi:hypothetical protein HID58_064215, partial [Brassica napus]